VDTYIEVWGHIYSSMRTHIYEELEQGLRALQSVLQIYSSMRTLDIQEYEDIYVVV
jgi:hypothetical protein